MPAYTGSGDDDPIPTAFDVIDHLSEYRVETRQYRYEVLLRLRQIAIITQGSCSSVTAWPASCWSPGWSRGDAVISDYWRRWTLTSAKS
jgi:hypothetical protein